MSVAPKQWAAEIAALQRDNERLRRALLTQPPEAATEPTGETRLPDIALLHPLVTRDLAGTDAAVVPANVPHLKHVSVSRWPHNSPCQAGK